MLCAYSGYLYDKFSMKSNVFSFVVILLEIISGRKNRGFHHPDHDQSSWTCKNFMLMCELVSANSEPSVRFSCV